MRYTFCMNEKRNLLFFPIGTIGRDMVYQLFTNFIFTFVLFTRELSNAQIAMLTAIIVGARIFDAANDPLMGNIIDRTRSPFGKFKPWLTLGIILTAVVVIASFNVDLEGNAFIVFFALMYFLYSIVFTMHDISYWGMIPSLAKDAYRRDIFTSLTNLCVGIGNALAGILIPLFTIGSLTLAGSTKAAYGILAIIFSLVGILFLSFTIFLVKENRDYEKLPVPPISLKKIISVFKNNDQVLWMALILLLQQTGQTICTSGLGATYIYFEFGYEGGLWSLFTTAGLAPCVFLMIAYPAIAKKFSRKTFMTKMLFVSSFGYLGMLLVGMAFLQSNYKFYFFTATYAIANFGFYAFYLIMMISLLNTVEYNEWKCGERNDAIITSVRPFVTKLATALSVSFASFAYILFRVTKQTNAIASLEQSASRALITEAEKLNAIQTMLSSSEQSQRIGMLVFITVIPFLFMLASYILYQTKYTIDETKYTIICEEIKTRR